MDKKLIEIKKRIKSFFDAESEYYRRDKNGVLTKADHIIGLGEEVIGIIDAIDKGIWQGKKIDY